MPLSSDPDPDPDADPDSGNSPDPDDDRRRLLGAIAAATILSALVGSFVAIVLAFVVIPLILPPIRGDVFFVNIVGHFVGLFALASAVFLQVGPRLPFRYTPNVAPPWQAIALFYILGVGIVLTTVRILTRTRAAALAWRAVAYIVFFAACVSILVYVIDEYTDVKTVRRGHS